MSDRLDPTFVRAQIEHLRLIHPDIWEDGDEALLTGMLEGSTDLHEFLAAVVRRMLEAEALAGGISDLIYDLNARASRFGERKDAMRALAFKLMSAAEVRKVELSEATLSIRAGSAKVVITDEAALPPDCVRVRTEPDKVAIKRFIEEGSTIPGAEMSNSEPVLSIRVK